jgi:hypothetical protein
VTDIDSIRAAITGDYQAVLKQQVDLVQREIIERLAINITTREAIHELISHVRRSILQLEPAHEGLPDDPGARRERLVLEHEFRTLVLRLSEEQRNCWSDVQRLKAELRLCERDLLGHQKRDARLGSIR